MKYFSILSICLLIISCGPRELVNADIQDRIIGKNSVFNTINLGDSWEDTKTQAGNYWEVREDAVSNVYQFRRDLNLGSEFIFIDFKLDNNKVGAIGLHISSSNIPQGAFMLHTMDLVDLYKRKFDLNLENRTEELKTVNGKTYGYQLSQNLREESSTLMVFCTVKS